MTIGFLKFIIGSSERLIFKLNYFGQISCFPTSLGFGSLTSFTSKWFLISTTTCLDILLTVSIITWLKSDIIS